MFNFFVLLLTSFNVQPMHMYTQQELQEANVENELVPWRLTTKSQVSQCLNNTFCLLYVLYMYMYMYTVHVYYRYIIYSLCVLYILQVVKGLMAFEIQRQEVLKELVHTERTHRKKLLIMKHVSPHL